MRLQYVVTLESDEYAKLMMLVMRFGTGIDLGGSPTSCEMRLALSSPTFKTVPDAPANSSED